MSATAYIMAGQLREKDSHMVVGRVNIIEVHVWAGIGGFIEW